MGASDLSITIVQRGSQVYTLTYERWDGSDASDAREEAAAEDQPAANPVRAVKHGGGHAVVRC